MLITAQKKIEMAKSGKLTEQKNEKIIKMCIRKPTVQS